MRVLAIGTHPDDIEIACSRTLAKCVKRGDTVIVCHASSGDLGHVVIHQGRGYEENAPLRLGK